MERGNGTAVLGIPVKVGNGCATVTGYETLAATQHSGTEGRGRQGGRFETRSQDIGCDALNSVCSPKEVQTEKTCSQKIRLRLRQSPGGREVCHPAHFVGRGLKRRKVNRQLLLLRHASHSESDTHCFWGSTDLGISESGCLEAASSAPLVQYHQPECCLCSPLRRCIETAERVSRIRIEINPDLREIDFGRWEGRTFSEIQQSDPSAVARWAEFDPDFAFPGGERLVDFSARVRRVADMLASRPEKSILAVTHAGIIRALICHFLGLHPRQYVLFRIGFASLTVLDLFGERGVLAGLNICCRTEER